MKTYDFSHLEPVWQHCIADFLESIYQISGSSQSRTQYASVLARFFRDVAPQDATRADVQRFLAQSSESPRNYGQPIHTATSNGRLRSLNSLYKYASTYLVDGEPLYTKMAPSFGLKFSDPPVPYRNMSEDEVRRFFDAIPNDVRGCRSRAIFLFAFFTTRRRAEIARLKWGDIEPAIIIDSLPDGTQHSRAGYIFRHVDKGKAREVHSSELPQICYDALVDMLTRQSRLACIRPEDPLFASVLERDKARTGGITPDYLNACFHEVARAAGLDDSRLSFHSLRHAGASARYREGERLDSLMRILGHSNILSTDRYIKSLVPVSDTFGLKMQTRFGYLAAH